VKRLKLLNIVLGFILLATAASAMQPLSFKNPLIGKKAPDFTLKTLSGKDVNFTEYRDGKKAIVFFWATWCPHCREALRDLTQQQKTIEAQGIRLALVDLGEPSESVKTHFQKNYITLDSFLDERSSLEKSYAIIGIPTFFFVDENGVVMDVKHSLPEDLKQAFE